MKKWLKKHLKNEKGLTLVELLAVIVILGIIAAIAVPSIGKIIDNTRDKAVLADASNILSAAKLAVVEGACDSDTTCTAENLKDFVEGIEEGVDFSATKGDEWSVKYDKLSDIDEESRYNVGGDTISESELNKLLGNKQGTE